MPRWVVVIDPADRRWTALSEALARRGQPVTLVPWAEAAARPERVGQLARPGDVLRLDSPGSDPQVWSLLSGSATAPGVW
ncbi:MAG TPA: hypothetical protein PKA64_12305, partial [Myxococcota bacterium]|nr:hypothetical protein [Myxococcota bacterium]